VCPAGTTETSTGNCTKCPLGSYCPAGTGNGASAAQNVGTTLPLVVGTEIATSGQRSYQITCGLNMTTRLTGAKEEISCVTSAGYFFGGPGTNATICPTNTYNTGGNRLPSCYTCPSGLITTTQGSTSKLNCLVPGGYIMNRGVVTPCPKGTYRDGDALPTAQLNCTRCARGWTTGGVGTTLVSGCSRTLPGFYALVGNQGLGSSATLPCPVGSWSTEAGGNTACSSCSPYGWTTKNNTLDTDGLAIGATSQSACANPPGYFTQGTSALQSCPDGTYASGWARRASCTSCGTGISSEPRTVDDTDASLFVSAQPSDCYMPAGYGMTFNRTSGLFTAAICPNNTYGSIEQTYGLKFSPCKPCPRGLVTSGPGMISKDNCTNPAGWGWNGYTAEICPPGSYVAANTLLSCTACPLNRNTTSITSPSGVPFTDMVSAMPLPLTTGTDMNDFADCKVIAGYGLMNSTGVVAAADILTLTNNQKAGLDVGECPLGSYSTGGDVGSTCLTCAANSNPTGSVAGTGLGPYSTTLETGSANVTDCNVCLPGYGTLPNTHSNSSILCTGCLNGYYSAGSTTTCTSCGTVQPFSYPGKNELITTTPTTKIGTQVTPGARSTDECYPSMWQLDESMGTHLVNTTGYPGYTPPGVQNQAGSLTTAQACYDNCAASTICWGATWIYNDTISSASNIYTGVCLWYMNNPGGGTNTLYVKVLPMDYMAGATKDKAAVASGSYVKYSTVNPNLGATITGGNTTSTDTPLPACKALCDQNPECWGFYYNGHCVIRKGLEGEGHRSFIHVIGANVE